MITIIIMLILATVTVTVAINGEIFNHAGKAKLRTEVASIKEEFMRKKLLDEIEDGEIDNVLGKKTGYNDILAIQNGELVYYKDKVKENKKTWLEELGIEERKPTVKELVIAGEIKVGDYVDYKPTEGIYKVADGEYGSGYTTDEGYQEFKTETDLEWRVWSIDEKTGEIELVSATNTESKLYLKGADGYNHAVDILNDLCENLYSKKDQNGKKLATARSINVDDINAKTTYPYTTYVATYEYGKKIPINTCGGWYPNLYNREKGYGIAETFNQELEESKGLKDGVTDEDGVTIYSTVKGSTNGIKAGTDSYITYTYYMYVPESWLNNELGVNTAPTGLMEVGTTYWLASRCAYACSYDVYFWVRCSYNSNNCYLFDSTGHSVAYNNAVRPVVSLRSNVLLTKDETNVNEGVTYWNIKF